MIRWPGEDADWRSVADWRSFAAAGGAHRWTLKARTLWISPHGAHGAAHPPQSPPPPHRSHPGARRRKHLARGAEHIWREAPKNIWREAPKTCVSVSRHRHHRASPQPPTPACAPALPRAKPPRPPTVNKKENMLKEMLHNGTTSRSVLPDGRACGRSGGKAGRVDKHCFTSPTNPTNCDIQGASGSSRISPYVPATGRPTRTRKTSASQPRQAHNAPNAIEFLKSCFLQETAAISHQRTTWCLSNNMSYSNGDMSGN